MLYSPARLNCAVDPGHEDCPGEGSLGHIELSVRRRTNTYQEVKGREPEVINVVRPEGRVGEVPPQADQGMVEAGMQVSRWYLQQLRAERPKGGRGRGGRQGCVRVV